MPVTIAQVRMARAALQWNVGDLGEKALISPAIVAAVEAGQEARAADLMVLQRALEPLASSSSPTMVAGRACG
jgi:hypothetical protein